MTPNTTGLYVNPFDPNETAHVSVKLADLVCGEFVLEGLSHELRATRLAALIRVYEAVIDIGDLEHTADWDWRITVQTLDGTLIPDETPEDATVMCDTLELPYTVEPGDYTSGFARWTTLKAEIYNWSDDGGTTWAEIPIDSIKSITIEVL